MEYRLIFILFLFIAFPLLLFGQGRTITGQVTAAEDGTPIPGVNIVVQGANMGAVTGVNGNYELTLPGDTATLIFSFIGYKTQRIPVREQSVVNVRLAQDVTQLEEIVKTGYSTQKKRDITGSIGSVPPESFRDIQIAGVDQALQGQVSGVKVTQSSGEPGGGIMVRVRGSSSISGSNSPLYIVDGVPVSSGGLTGRSFGGQRDNALATLNPDNIASIEVLKDASAKAVYGSRAANGVVLITTKSGTAEGDTKFNLDVKGGMINITNTPDLLNSKELLNLQQEALRNAEQDPERAGVPGITDAVDTDWMDAVLRTAMLQNYQLSAQGGNQQTRFYASAAYRDEEGVMLNNSFQRWSAAMNLDHNASDKLLLELNLNLARTLNNRVKGDNFLDGVYSGAVTSLPYYAPYNESGELYAPGDANYAGFPNFNPVAQALEPRFDTHTSKLVGSISAEYSFSSNLNLRTQFSIDYNDVKEDQFEPTTTAIGGFLESVGQQGYGVNSNSEGISLVNSTVLTYNKVIGENHSINAMLGSEVTDNTGRSNSVTGILFPGNEFTYITSAGLVNQGSSFKSESGLISQFAQIQYDYAGKYLLSLSGRRDGSSKFGEDRRYGYFPAGSAGWRISEEEFFNVSAIDDLKIRGSYGITGNERIGNFQFLGTWGASTAYNNVPAVRPNSLANPLLQWEQTAEMNLGFDLSLWSGRVQMDFNVYNNVTNDLLLSETLPLTTGFGSVQGNLGEITNRGIELSFNSVNVDGIIQWSTDFNISANRNNVVALATDEPQFPGYQTFTNSTHIIKPGEPLGSFWGLRYLGVDPGTGDAIYDDINGDGRITADDGTIIGNAQPDFQGGITNSFSYGGWNMRVFFQYSYGNQMVNFSKTTLLNTGENLENNQVREALDRWQEPGDITHVPKYEHENTFNNRFSSRFVEDASYIRLKNVSLGYNLPAKWLQPFKLREARIYASGTNVLTFTNYTGADPELNTLDGSTVAQGMELFTLPQVRTISVGLNVGF